MDKLYAVLCAMLPKALADNLIDLDADSIAELTLQYIEADEIARGDIIAFFESAGGERVRELALRDNEEVPTRAELNKWLDS